MKPSVKLGSCKPIGHLLLLLTCNIVVRITLMNEKLLISLYHCMSNIMGFMYYFDGVTPSFVSSLTQFALFVRPA